jgi:hypothetical protein
MDHLALSLTRTILIGLGATLLSDLWALFLKVAFRMSLPSFCLVGRWILYMPEGRFKHANIASTPQKNGECTVGWIAHYMIGILFAIVFVTFAGADWLQHPTVIPAIVFGIVTVIAPLFIMQPAFEYGIAASKVANPTQARLRSLMNHTVFGLGLYLFGLPVSWLM